VSETKTSEECMVHEAREEYFAGKISADEYLRRVLPAMDHDRRLADQFSRIFSRLSAQRNAR
jgi:hypothetical protein